MSGRTAAPAIDIRRNTAGNLIRTGRWPWDVCIPRNGAHQERYVTGGTKTGQSGAGHGNGGRTPPLALCLVGTKNQEGNVLKVCLLGNGRWRAWLKLLPKSQMLQKDLIHRDHL
jgi:hypothetical protein